MMILRGTLLFVLVSLVAMAGCAQGAADSGPAGANPYLTWRTGLELPAGSPVYDHPEPTDCSSEIEDEGILECAEKQFWRVFQRDVNDRRALWEQMFLLEEGLSPDLEAKKRAEFIFRRAQLALTYMVEHTVLDLQNGGSISPEDFEMLGSLAADAEAAVELDPDEPFYVTWLDALRIATADSMGQMESMVEAAAEAWVNVENENSNTTRSTLVASLTGTAIAMPLSSGVPHRTMELLETFECHPKVLMANPDSICGKGVDKRSCHEWCLANSQKAPFGGPGLMYHIGEHYARMGDGSEAARMYELALTLPGAEIWPYRERLVTALDDIDAHVARFTDLEDDASAQAVAYATGADGCSLCHGDP